MSDRVQSLLEALDALGLGPVAVARGVEISPGYVSRMRRGERVPSADRLLMLEGLLRRRIAIVKADLAAAELLLKEPK